jgi:L-fuculose-phosphate aldolase
MMGVFLERACRSQLTLLATGLAFNATAPEEIAEKHAEIFDPGLIETFWAFFKRQTDQLRAAR